MATSIISEETKKHEMGKLSYREDIIFSLHTKRENMQNLKNISKPQKNVFCGETNRNPDKTMHNLDAHVS